MQYKIYTCIYKRELPNLNSLKLFDKLTNEIDKMADFSKFTWYWLKHINRLIIFKIYETV